MNRYFWILGAFIALAALLAVGLGLNPREVPSPLVGKPAPAFKLAVLGKEGETMGQRRCAARCGCSNVRGPAGASPAGRNIRCWWSFRGAVTAPRLSA